MSTLLTFQLTHIVFQSHRQLIATRLFGSSINQMIVISCRFVNFRTLENYKFKIKPEQIQLFRYKWPYFVIAISSILCSASASSIHFHCSLNRTFGAHPSLDSHVILPPHRQLIDIDHSFQR